MFPSRTNRWVPVWGNRAQVDVGSGLQVVGGE
jgi:hypothetical protein